MRDDPSVFQEVRVEHSPDRALTLCCAFLTRPVPRRLPLPSILLARSAHLPHHLAIPLLPLSPTHRRPRVRGRTARSLPRPARLHRSLLRPRPRWQLGRPSPVHKVPPSAGQPGRGEQWSPRGLRSVLLESDGQRLALHGLRGPEGPQAEVRAQLFSLSSYPSTEMSCTSGTLKIAEVTSRFTSLPSFISHIEKTGFKLRASDSSNTHFVLLEFTKIPRPLPLTDEDLKEGGKLLKPCLYKKR